MSKKEDIINTALDLFNQIGYNATGVDKIIAESNVAKMTFYKYFPSKESLIMECLHHRNINIQNSIYEKLNLHPDAEPLERIHLFLTGILTGLIAKTLTVACLRRHLLKYLNNTLQFVNHFKNIQIGLSIYSIVY